MVGTSAIAIAVGAGLGGFALLLAGRRWRRRRADTEARRALARTLEARLADRMAPGTGTHLERAPTVRRIAVVDTDGSADESPASLPIVRVDLGTVDPPGPKLRFEYVAAVLEAIHPILVERKERVHCYDVEFAFGPDGLLVDGECRRVSVTPALADRLCTDDRYDAFDLRRDVESDARNSDTPTTVWGDCRDAVRRT